MRVRILKGYEFLTLHRVVIRSRIINVPFETDWVRLQVNGTLIVNANYAWDGLSIPGIQTRKYLIPSLVHDCFYQAMREGPLDRSERKDVDREFHRMCLKYGMHKTLAWCGYYFVRLFGKKHSKPRKHPRGEIIEEQVIL